MIVWCGGCLWYDGWYLWVDGNFYGDFRSDLWCRFKLRFWWWWILSRVRCNWIRSFLWWICWIGMFCYRIIGCFIECFGNKKESYLRGEWVERVWSMGYLEIG